MKGNNIIRRIVVFLLCMAITLSYMPASFYAYAQDGEETASGEPKTEAVSEAPKAEEKNAEPEKKDAPQAEEKIVEEKTEAKAEAAEMQQIVKEESAAAIEAETVKANALEEKAVEEKAEEKVAEEAVEEDAPVVVLDQEASDKLTVHVSNILWAAKKKVDGKAVPFETTLTLSKNQTKLATGFYSSVGGKTVSPATTTDGRYTFLQVFALAKSGSGIVTANSAAGVKAIQKIGFKDGTATITFADGSTKQYVNASDIYISPVYSVEYNFVLNVKYIDNISTAGGSWGGALSGEGYTHTFKQPDAQEHYEFISWESDESKAAYDAGDKVTIKTSDYKGSKEATVTYHTKWQPSVTVRYHYNGETAEVESFKDIKVYDKNSEIDGIAYNAWYDADGKVLDEDAAFAAPAPVTEKAERTIHDVYARRPVTVTAATSAWTFDGKAHSDNEVAVTEGGLFEGDEIVAEVSGSITEVGKTENRIESIKIMRGSEDVSEYYDITTVDGALSINAAPAAPAGNTPKDKKPVAQTVTDTNVAETATIADDAVPAAAPKAETVSIADNETPLAKGTWALINLIAAVMTALGAIIAIFRRKEEEDEDDIYMAEDDNRSKKMFATKMAGALTGIAALITFFITEDMSLQMAMIDKYTVLMIVMLGVQILAAALNKKASELDDEQEMAGEAAE